MAAIENEHSYAIQIRESADDGSDFGAADADYRRLYLGEDGQLHTKDAASAVVDLTKLNKWNGTAAPTVNEDSGDGYAPGSMWIDTTNDKAYVCLDASVGAAVWTETTVTGGAATLQAAKYTRSAGDYTGITSTSFVDLDGTNMVHTFTTGARRVLLMFSGSGAFTSGSGQARITFNIDSTDVGGTAGIVSQFGSTTAAANLTTIFLTDTLTAASHTFKVRICVSAGTFTVSGNTNAVCSFSAVELYA